MNHNKCQIRSRYGKKLCARVEHDHNVNKIQYIGNLFGHTSILLQLIWLKNTYFCSGYIFAGLIS